MKSQADRAVALATAQGLESLDFTIQSIKTVEIMLGDLYEAYISRTFWQWLRNTPPDRDQLREKAAMYGAYVGEVLILFINGQWEEENGVPVVKNAKGTIFPVEKVFKRLTNGPEDDLVFYIDRAVAHLK